MSHSCDEQYAVYNERKVTARKPFECDAVICSVVVRPGDTYTKVTTIYDGRVETHRRCPRCQHLHEHLRSLCWQEGEMWPDERLGCGLDYEEEWGELPPEIAALAFWQPGEPLPATNRCTEIANYANPARWMAPGCVDYSWRSTAKVGCQHLSRWTPPDVPHTHGCEVAS